VQQPGCTRREPQADRQVLDAGDIGRAQVLHGPRRLHRLDRSEELLEPYPQADPGHGVADAVMRPDTEGEMVVGPPPRIEPVRVDEASSPPQSKPEAAPAALRAPSRGGISNPASTTNVPASGGNYAPGVGASVLLDGSKTSGIPFAPVASDLDRH